MVTDQLLTRQVPLQKLEPLCRALGDSLTRGGLTPEQSQELWRVGVAAECTRCGIPIYGDELYALSQPPSEKYANIKLGRLRLGDCAREGCNSYTYKLTFYPYNNLDWPTLLAAIDRNEKEPGNAPVRPGIAQALNLLWRSSAARRVALGLIVVVLLLVVRQWYLGGRIPLLREPRKFQVDPGSVESTTQ